MIQLFAKGSKFPYTSVTNLLLPNLEPVLGLTKCSSQSAACVRLFSHRAPHPNHSISLRAVPLSESVRAVSLIAEASSQNNKSKNGIFWLAGSVGAIACAALATAARVHAAKDEDSWSMDEYRKCAAIFGCNLLPKEAKETDKNYRQKVHNQCFDLLYKSAVNQEYDLLKQARYFVDSLGDQWGRTVLLRAAMEGRTELVLGLIHCDFSVSVIDRHGNNALHLSAEAGYEQLVILLSNHLPVNDKNKQGFNALQLATIRGHASILAVLLGQGASIHASSSDKDRKLLPPVALAIVHSQKECLDELLKGDHRKLLDRYSTKEGNLLHLALNCDRSEMVQHLLKNYHLEMERAFKEQDEKGRTPFHLACYLGDCASIRCFNDHRVDIDLPDRDGKTGVHWAVLGEQPGVIQLLDYLGANLELSDDGNRRPSDTCAEQLSKENRNRLFECAALLDKLPRMAKKLKTSPPDFLHYPPENLILKGGGPKGLAYIGALQEMEKLGLLNELKRVAGSSAGAITATLLAVGFNPTELENALKEKEILEFLDPKGQLERKLTAVLTSEAKAEKMDGKRASVKVLKGILHEYWHGWGTMLHPIARARELQRQLSSLTGLCDGEDFLTWLDGKIFEKTGMRNCTFGELRDLTFKDPQQFKELRMYSVKLAENESTLVRFGFEEKWDRLIISHAVRSSMSIPGVFKPHTLQFKDSENKSYARSELGRYIDGGVIKNFPLDAFDTRQGEWGSRSNRRSLGLSLQEVSAESEQPGPSESKEPMPEKFGAKELASQLMSVYWASQEILDKEFPFNAQRQIVIPVKGVTLLSFELSADKKKELIESGRKQIKLAFAQSIADIHHFIDPAKALLTQIDRPSSDFSGRDEYFKILERNLLFASDKEKAFQRELPSKVQILWGLGRIGKSQIASQFAYRYLQRFGLIWTFHCDSPDRLAKDYRELATRLKIHLTEDMAFEDIRQQVHARLENNLENKPWLFIFDGVQRTLSEVDFPSKGGCVLATASQKNVWQDEESLLRVTPLSKHEGKHFLQKITHEPDSPAVDQLVEDTEGLPFLLRAIALYIRQIPGLTIAEYLQNFDLRKNALDKGIPPDQRLSEVWETTLERLGKDHAHASDWLNHCAYLYGKDVPEIWIEKWLKEKGVLQPRLRAKEILRDLTNFGLIEYNPAQSSFSMNQFLQQVLRKRLEDKSQDDKLIAESIKLLTLCGGSMDNTFAIPYMSQKIVKHSESISDVLFQLGSSSPHLDSALNFLLIAGNQCLQLDQPSKAQAVFLRAQQLIFKSYPSLKNYPSKTPEEIAAILVDDREVFPLFSRILHYLGKSNFQRGEIASAEPLLEKAVELRSFIDNEPQRRYVANHHIDSLIFQRQGLGWLWLDSDKVEDLQKAEDLYKQLYFYPKKSEDFSKFQHKQFGDYEPDSFNQAYCNLQLARIYLKKTQLIPSDVNYKLAMQHIKTGGVNENNIPFRGALQILQEHPKAIKKGAYLLILGDLYVDPASPFFNISEAEKVLLEVTKTPKEQKKILAQGYCKLGKVRWLQHAQNKHSKSESKTILHEAQEAIEKSLHLIDEIEKDNSTSHFIAADKKEAQQMVDKISLVLNPKEKSQCNIM